MALQWFSSWSGATKQSSCTTDDNRSCAGAHACANAAARVCMTRRVCAGVCAGVNGRETHLPYSHACSHAVQNRGGTDKRKSRPCWCTRAGSRRCPCCTHLCLWETHMQHVTRVEAVWEGGHQRTSDTNRKETNCKHIHKNMLQSCKRVSLQNCKIFIAT